MIKYILCITYIFSCCYSCLCLSNYDAPKPLILNQLVDNVLRNNPNLETVKERIRAAKFKIIRVQVLDDPEFMAMIHGNPIDGYSRMNPSIRFEIGQKIPLSNKLSAQGLIAKQSLEVIHGEKITTEKELILQTKIAYFKLLFNDISLKINQHNQRIAERIIDDSLAIYRSGKGGQQEILKAKVELQLLKKDYLNLCSDQISIQAMINVLLNKPQESPVANPEMKLHKSLTFFYKELEAIAMETRSELQSKQAMVQEQYAMEKLAKAHYYPDARFGFRYERLTGEEQSFWGISVMFNVPVWINKKQRNELEEAKANALAQQNDLHAIQLMIQGKIKETLAKLVSADDQITLYKKEIIPDIKQTLSASQAKYRVGKGDFLFLLDTRRQLYNTQLTYYQLCIDREILLAELERAIGMPLKNALRIMRNSHE